MVADWFPWFLPWLLDIVRADQLRGSLLGDRMGDYGSIVAPMGFNSGLSLAQDGDQPQAESEVDLQCHFDGLFLRLEMK